MAVKNDVVVAGATTAVALEPNPGRLSALFVNDHAVNTLWLRLEAIGAVNQGIRLNAAGGSYQIDLLNMYRGRVYVIASAANTNLLVTEVSV